MTFFQVGDRVRAQGKAKGGQLQQGVTYTVAEVEQRTTAFGNFVAYWVRPDGGDTLTAVYNAHLLLERVS